MKEKIDLLPDQNEICLLIKGAFSKDICLEIIEEHKRGFLPAHTNYPTSYRNNDRQLKDDAAFASFLFREIRKYIPTNINSDGISKYEKGSWSIIGLNDRIRICRYLPGQYFNKHLDGIYHKSEDEQSKLTFMIYLNGVEDFDGGRTLFYKSKRDDEIVGSYSPEQGDLIIFDHNLWHAGEQVVAGEKYILRSDILYKREGHIKLSGSKLYEEGHYGYIWKVIRLDNYLITCGRDKKIKIWNKEGRKIEELIGHENSILDIIALSGKRLLSCSRDRTIRLWSKSEAGYLEVKKIKAHKGTILSLCGLPEGGFVSSGADGFINIYDDEGELINTIKGHNEWIWSIKVLNNDTLVSVGEDGNIRIWSLKELMLICQKNLKVPLTALAYDHHQQVLYVGGVDGRLWRLKYDGKEITISSELKCNEDKIWVIKVDEKRLATGGEDNKVILRNKDTFEIITEYEHENFVQDLLLEKDKIVSVSYSGEIRELYLV